MCCICCESFVLLFIVGQFYHELKFVIICVGHGESVATVENRPVDDHIGKFTWSVANFTKISVRKHYSEMFVVGGYKWYGIRVVLVEIATRCSELIATTCCY